MEKSKFLFLIKSMQYYYVKKMNSFFLTSIWPTWKLHNGTKKISKIFWWPKKNANQRAPRIQTQIKCCVWQKNKYMKKIMPYQEWVRADWHVRHVKNRGEKWCFELFTNVHHSKKHSFTYKCNSQAKHKSKNLFFFSFTVCVCGRAYVHH